MHRQSCLKTVVLRRLSQSVFIDLARGSRNDRSRKCPELEIFEQMPSVTHEGGGALTRARSQTRTNQSHTTFKNFSLFLFFFFAQFFDFLYVLINLALKYGNNFKFASISFSGYEPIYKSFNFHHREFYLTDVDRQTSGRSRSATQHERIETS